MIESNRNNKIIRNEKIGGEVIGIGRWGDTKRIDLVERDLTHAEATKEVARELFVKMESSIGPVKAGRNAADVGLVIFQIAGDTVCLYLPETLKEDQNNTLEEILKEKSNSTFYVSYQEEIYNDIDVNEVLSMIGKLKSNHNRTK